MSWSLFWGLSHRGSVDVQFPGESTEYREARNHLLEQEIELRRRMEAVAAARRELPPGGVVPEDYAFQGEGPNGEPMDVRLSAPIAVRELRAKLLRAARRVE